MNMTPKQLTEKTVKDIQERKKLSEEGKRQALKHCMENREKIRRRTR